MLISQLTGERGCDRCHGVIMVKVESKAGLIELCWDDALKQLGRDSAWLEERHREFEDHVLLAFRRAAAKEAEPNKELPTKKLAEVEP